MQAVASETAFAPLLIHPSRVYDVAKYQKGCCVQKQYSVFHFNLLLVELKTCFACLI